MFDTPDTATLLFGLAAFLEHDVRPAQQDAALAFRVRIAAHVAQTLALQEGAVDAALAGALASGRDALGEPPGPIPGTRAELAAAVAATEARLAAAIRDGAALDAAKVTTHLMTSLGAELAVTNPAFDQRPDPE